MGAVLQFTKTHFVALISGVVIIASFVVAAMGMGSEAVIESMNDAKRSIGADNIRSLRSAPKNEAIIEAELKKNEQFANEYDKFVKAAEAINRREPLMAGVFPTPERTSTPLKFVEAYRKRLEQLPRRLDAGTLPTAEDLAEEEQNVQDLIVLEAEQDEEGAVEGGNQRQPAVAPSNRFRPQGGGGMRPTAGMRPAGGLRPTPGMQPGGMRPAGGMRPTGRTEANPWGGMNPGMRGQAASPSSSSYRVPSDEPKYNAVIRARVTKALGVRCYVEPYLEGTKLSPTFHVSPIIEATSTPSTEDMWFAQMTLWVQEDVLKAISNLNSAAARAVTEGDANVQHMPVKRLKMVRVTGYELEKGAIDFPAWGTNRTVGPATGTVTQRTANDLYDVVRYKVAMIVDQRQINAVVDEICKANFAQCVELSYFAVDRNNDELAEGYYYGTAPAVDLHMEFESYFLRSAYVDLMPNSVKTMLGIATDE